MHNGKNARQDRFGYVFIWEPTYAKASYFGWVQEHRFIAEQRLGRPLSNDGHVHHVNGIKDDNRPENLEVVSPSEHMALTSQQIAERKEQERVRIAGKLSELEEYQRRFGPLGES